MPNRSNILLILTDQQAPERAGLGPAVTAAVAVVACVCSLIVTTPSAAADERPVTLRLEGAPSATAGAGWGRLRYENAKRFREKHPNVIFEHANELQLPISGLSKATQFMQIAGETAPDVYSDVYLQDLLNYVRQGFVRPIDDLIQQDRQWWDNGPIPARLREATKIDGHYYGAIESLQLFVRCLVYRKDLFREAGLDENRPPRTWDEFYHVCQRLYWPDKVVKRAEISSLRGQVGFGLMTDMAGAKTFQTLLQQAGGALMQARKTCPQGHVNIHRDPRKIVTCAQDGADLSAAQLQWRATFNDHAGNHALNFMRKLRWSRWTRCPHCTTSETKQGIVDISTIDVQTGEEVDMTGGHRQGRCPACGEVVDLDAQERDDKVFEGVIRLEATGGAAVRGFYNGANAMLFYFTGQFFLRHLEATGIPFNDVGVAALPYYKEPYPNMAVIRLDCINSAVKDPRKVAAAWEYIKETTGHESEATKTRLFVEGGVETWVFPPSNLLKYGYPQAYEKIPKNYRDSVEQLIATCEAPVPAPELPRVLNTYIPVPVGTIMLDETARSSPLLDDAARKTNRYVLKHKTPKQRYRDNIIGASVVVIGALLVLYGLTRVIRLARRQKAQQFESLTGSGTGSRLRTRKHVTAWLFLLPAMALVLLFQYYPLFRGSVMAFFDYKLLGGVRGSRFVGFGNFVDALSDPFFWQVTLQTVQYVFWSLALGFLAPLILALYLSEVPRFKVIFRTIYYLPSVTTGLVIMLMWMWLMDSSPSGVFNRMLASVNLGPYGFLKDPNMAMPSIIIPGVWAGIGSGCLIYLAALKSIPTDLYDSAAIDGATVPGRVRHVTIPYLKPLLIINLVGAFIGAFHAATNVLVMTGGGPMNKTRVLGLEIWLNAFLYLRFGYATAMAWIMGSLLIGFTLYQLRILKKVEFRTASAD